MTDELTFVDTNVLLYAHDRSASVKHDLAVELLAGLWGSRAGALSTQVLQEFYVNATRRLPRPLSASRARAVIGRFATWHLHRIEAADNIAASELETRHRLAFWDSLIIISAAQSGATTLVSEDMHHGRRIAGLTIVNPFGPHVG